jgi:hypothetical protein
MLTGNIPGPIIGGFAFFAAALLFASVRLASRRQL